MAFEAFLTQGKTKPRKARWITGTVSITFHGALLVAALVWSYWNVDELSPPTVTVTFITAAPPPPPPPPPRKKPVQKAKPTPVVREIVQPKPGQLSQPKEKEVVEEDEEGVDYGVEGGVGSAPPPPPPPENVAPKMLSMAIASSQMLTNPATDPQYRFPIPPTLNRAGVKMFAIVKICVAKTGDVESVKLIKGMDPAADPLLLAKAKTWKYKPFTIDGRPVPFCYPLRYDVVIQ